MRCKCDGSSLFPRCDRNGQGKCSIELVDICDHEFLPILYGCPPEIYAPEVKAGRAFAGGNRMPNAPDYRCKKCGAGKQNDL
jgi:hypothetical protein